MTDEKGRKDVADMTTDEKLEEILLTMRAVGDGLEALGKNPMMKAMMPKLNLPS